ncbi:MAG: diguanylate cyclase [Candidatus Hinthialibacter antarcticus]|nr:diguanylate cyclase [Candidatus Hinthialibacter antarcticus]
MGAQLIFSKSVTDLLHAALGLNEDESAATLDRLLSSAADEEQSITFFLCCIDSFAELAQRKPEALKKAASGLLGVLMEQTPEDVFIDCIGVNEFLLVAPSVDREQAARFGEELQRRFCAMADAIRTRPKIHITMSVAAGRFPDDASHRGQLIRGLREAVYLAQQKGKSQICFIEPPSHEANTVQLTSIQLEMLTELVQYEGRTLDSVIREAVDDVLAKHAPKPIES